jgi:uracil-DNA glycosylase family 4
MDNCPVCNSRIVPACGRIESDILIVGEFPGADEMERGAPFVGTAGEILNYELGRVGIDMWSCRLTNMWLHYMNKEIGCFEYGLKELTLEMAGRKVLLMGSELCNYFLGEKVSKLYGLVVESALFPRSMQFAMIAPNPGIALHQPVGELRLSIQKFAHKSKEVVCPTA